MGVQNTARNPVINQVSCHFNVLLMALTSLTSGGRSVGIVRSRTKAVEFSLAVVVIHESDLSK
jgi:hypothetical protein